MDYTRKSLLLFDSANQSIKNCKKQTPDYIAPNPKKNKSQTGFRTKDKVYVKGVSLVNKKELDGEYIFDSYDNYDNSCYVVDGVMTWNVSLNDIILN